VLTLIFLWGKGEVGRILGAIDSISIKSGLGNFYGLLEKARSNSQNGPEHRFGCVNPKRNTVV